jgi:hypothetical protein
LPRGTVGVIVHAHQSGDVVQFFLDVRDILIEPLSLLDCETQVA